LKELKQIRNLLEQKVSEKQLKKRVAKAYEQREQRRYRRHDNFAQRIRREERKRFKRERQHLLARIPPRSSVASEESPGNGTFKEPADHPVHSESREIQSVTEECIPPDVDIRVNL
jgi:hypothetical protein